MPRYDKPPELYAGLRLHQNEHTGGCSPRVRAAVAALTAEDLSVYPPYRAAASACARHFGVAPENVALVNGLDEGILAAAIAHLKPSPDGGRFEAIVPEPAFETFSFLTEVVDGRVVRVPPRDTFSFPLEEILESITPRTRVVWVTNPNNPTGQTVPTDAIREIAERLPRPAIVFVDEAYGDFGGESFIPSLAAFPNVVVGRTFAKAYGLAGLNIGAVIGADTTLDPLRRAIGVYSVNAVAAAALPVALDDQEYVRDYIRQVEESKALVYAACDRLGLTYWRSAANFVLIRTGGDVPALVAAAEASGIYLRNRSNEPGCAGCIRLTTGIVEHTRRAIAVLDEVLCAAR